MSLSWRNVARRKCLLVISPCIGNKCTCYQKVKRSITYGWFTWSLVGLVACLLIVHVTSTRDRLMNNQVARRHCHLIRCVNQSTGGVTMEPQGHRFATIPATYRDIILSHRMWRWKSIEPTSVCWFAPWGQITWNRCPINKISWPSVVWMLVKGLVHRPMIQCELPRFVAAISRPCYYYHSLATATILSLLRSPDV